MFDQDCPGNPNCSNSQEDSEQPEISSGKDQVFRAEDRLLREICGENWRALDIPHHLLSVTV